MDEFSHLKIRTRSTVFIKGSSKPPQGSRLASSFYANRGHQKKKSINFESSGAPLLGGSGMKRQQSNDYDTYWKDKVELLVEDKKKWVKEKKELMLKITTLCDKIEAIETKNKHLQNIIAGF